MSRTFSQCRLAKVEAHTPFTRSFFFEVLGVDDFPFVPGQFVTLDLPIGAKPRERWRSYSIASMPDGTPCFELVIVRVEGGRGTAFLFEELQPGDCLPFLGPLGKFTLPPDPAREICFICTGTGIAPFRSMLHHLHHNHIKTPPLHLVFGTRRKTDVLYFDEMMQLSREMPRFSYHPVLSRETATDWQHHRGYVHAVYQALFADGRPADFYLCGWKNMITEARERLQAMGYASDQVHFELYG